MTIDKPKNNIFYTLLNCSPKDSLFKAIPLDQSLSIKRFPDCIYHSYKPLGLSFSFISVDKPVDDCTLNDDHLKLDAIDIYNGTTKDSFLNYQLDIPLPCGITTSMVAHDIVSLLGEPDRKGGGGKSRTSCWIEYKFEEEGGGMMIQLHGIDWDDRNMGWTSIVLFK
ncbi:unnamed protein product [Cunninghamella blakesleeana]